MNLPRSLMASPPRKEVLLLSCMDLRLLDNTVGFMNQLNLQNRYDHLVLAGAAMGAMRGKSSIHAQLGHVEWNQVFFDHLATAINQLHREIKDIFLLEHLDCGAYKVLEEAPAKKKYTRLSNSGRLWELRPFHQQEAHAFAMKAKKYCWEQSQKKKAKDFDPKWWKNIRIHCLLMDLLGNVEDL